MSMNPVATDFSYYSEDQTIQIPAAKKTEPTTSAEKRKLFGRDLRDFDDNDLDSLLNNLSVEEMTELNNDFDPDVSVL